MKKIIGMLLTLVLVFGFSVNTFAAEKNNEDHRSNLPHNGAEHFELEVRVEDEESRISDFVTVYGYDYTRGSLKSGSWRNGASGGSAISASNLSLNYSNFPHQ